MKYKWVIVLVYAIIGWEGIATGTPTGLPPLLLHSLKTLNQLHGFSAEFTQTITYNNGNNSHYSGTIAVKRPGKFRWHYTTPYLQSYVSDGTAIWHYEPDLMQAVRMKDLGTVDPIAMQLLDGRIHASDLQIIRETAATSNSGDTRGSIRTFTVRIRNSITLTLSLDAKGNLVGITHTDALGNNNQIMLSAFEPTAPAEKLFHFTPPKGVDIIIEGEQ